MTVGTTRTPRSRSQGSYARITDEVCRVLSAREVAAAVGVRERTVQNWRAGSTRPTGASREALLDLYFVVEALSAVYSEEGVEVALRSRSKALGDRRPLDVFAASERESVVRLAGQIRDG